MSLEGNQFWRLAPKGGREKIFESPENLQNACEDYFDQTSKRTIEQEDYVGKDATLVIRKYKPPFTKTGLFMFLGIDKETWRNYRQKEGYEEFFGIVCAVDNIIYTHKFEGAAVGIYQQNIIARELGLVDRQEVKNTGAQSVIIESATPEEEKANQKTLDDIDNN